MATRYKATQELECWKVHTCVECGSVFRYRFRRTKVATGGSKEQALASARRMAHAAMTNEVDPHPCPVCGVYQPDMVASGRVRLHGWLLGVAAAGVLLPLILGMADVLTMNVAALAAAGVAAVMGVTQLLVDVRNPNRRLERNRALARKRQENRAIRLELLQPGEVPDPLPESRGLSFGRAHQAALTLFGLGVAALLAAEVLRVGQGWPLNPPWYPPVAGPGDRTYVYFPDKIQSIKGYWKGKPYAVVANAAEVGLRNPALSARSKDNVWGNKIEAKSDETASRSTLWAEITVPDEAELAGKTLAVRLRMDTSYPRMRGNDRFEEVRQRFQHQAELYLASPHAGQQYRLAWWVGGLGGAAAVVLASLWLMRVSRSLRKQANPTRVIAMDEGVPEGLAYEPPPG
jgi:hypothetical protein